jgi:hypothetical protein
MLILVANAIGWSQWRHTGGLFGSMASAPFKKQAGAQ